jgi:hypothetical protein
LGHFFGIGSSANQALFFKVPQFGFFPLVFEVTTSTMVTHYESLQEGAVDGTPLWGIILGSVQQPIRPLFSKVAAIWFFSCRF